MATVESYENLNYKGGSNGMGSLYASFILEGRITYAETVYLFYYKFPTLADDIIYTMDVTLRLEGRKDLLLPEEEVQEIKERAIANRKKLSSK